MRQLARWYTHKCTPYEGMFKALLTLEVGNAMAWVGLFIWTEVGYASTTPGMFAARQALLAAILSHLGTPNTIKNALTAVRKRRLAWLGAWWLLLSLATDVQSVVDAYRHLPNAPDGRMPLEVLRGLQGYAIVQLTLSTLSVIAFFINKWNAGEVPPECEPLMGRLRARQ